MPMPTPPERQQEPLLEVMYVLRTIMQSLDTVHQDLRRVMEEEGRARDHELDKIRDLITKNEISLATLPGEISNKLNRQVEKKVDDVLDMVRRNLDDMRQALWTIRQYRQSEAQTPQHGIQIIQQTTTPGQGVPILNPALLPPPGGAPVVETDVTAGLQLKKDGNVHFTITPKVITVAKWVGGTLVAAGSSVGFVEFIKKLFGW